MVETLNNIAAFISYYAAELVLGLVILAVITAFALLIVLIRRHPEDVISKLQDNFTDLGE